MGTKERIEILNNGNNVTNDLLKRISNLEFEVERYENIIDKLEKILKETYKENMDSASEKLWAIANQSMYIYNYIQELKGSDKE